MHFEVAVTFRTVDSLVQDDLRTKAVRMDFLLTVARIDEAMSDLQVFDVLSLGSSVSLQLLQQRSESALRDVVHLVFILIEEERRLSIAEIADLCYSCPAIVALLT